MERGVTDLDQESPKKEVSFDEEKLSSARVRKFLGKVDDWVAPITKYELGEYDTDMLIALIDAYIMYYKDSKGNDPTEQIDRLIASLTPEDNRPDSWPVFKKASLTSAQNNLAKVMGGRFRVIHEANVDIRQYSPFAVEELRDEIDGPHDFFKDPLNEDQIDWLAELHKDGYLLDEPDAKELCNTREEAYRLRLKGLTTKEIATKLHIHKDRVLEGDREMIEIIKSRLAAQTQSDFEDFLARKYTEESESSEEPDISTPEQVISIAGLARSLPMQDTEKLVAQQTVPEEIHNALELVDEAEARDRKAELYGRTIQNAPTNEEITLALRLLGDVSSNLEKKSRDELIERHKEAHLPRGSRAVMMGPKALQDRLDAYGAKLDTALENTIAWLFNPVYKESDN